MSIGKEYLIGPALPVQTVVAVVVSSIARGARLEGVFDVVSVTSLPPTDSSNWLDPPHNRLGFLRVAEWARTERVPRGAGPVAELPRDERSLDSFAFGFEGRDVSFASMLEETFTDGVLVLHDGVVVFEQYMGAMTPTDTHLLMSVSKSVNSTLCGICVQRGLLDPDDLVVSHLPELRNTAWQDCTIQHLLDMRTGTRWSYVDEIDIFDVSDYRTTERTDLPPDTAVWIRTVENAGPHGGGFRYVSLAADLLGWVLESVSGEKYSALLSREIWSQIGAERDAEMMVDAAGFAVVEGGLCATLRDVGRFGQLCLQNGGIAGREVIPAPWLGRLRAVDSDLIDAYAGTPHFDPVEPGAFYHDNWWVGDARAGIYSGLGVYGQTLLVHHPTRTVIVKLSSQPDFEDPRLWALQGTGLMALCESLR